MFSSTNYRKTVFFRYECNMAVKALPLVVCSVVHPYDVLRCTAVMRQGPRTSVFGIGFLFRVFLLV